ncbi:MAG TPA: CPBP family glutamic-type intramembrane protease, partial [Candidatus Lokiarchaeia archaeon]|nr:CPBP family glutamic-type intramembrane protease [Candidatus Lokiarchaeia archaeon]
MGVNESAAAAFQATPLGSIVVVVLAVVIALFLGIVVIRYDNFLNALKMAFVVIVILGIPLLLLALIVNPNVLSTIDPGNFAIGFAGYIFWGALQQLLFASYFGTRFRKAFSPSIQIAEPATAKREEEKALYKKRIVVSLLNGSFFGLIHIPSWTLMAFTMILGFFISWLYMKDGNRNLIAIGVIHGFLGTMASQFFSHNFVNLSVGPSSVPVAVVPWMWLVEIFVGLLLVAIVLIWRKYEMKPAPA